MLKPLQISINLFCLLFFSYTIVAQENEFRTAPESDQKVKKITEWISLTDENGKVKDTHKRLTYLYRTDGQPDSITGSSFQRHLSYFNYYNNGKLAKAYTYTEQDSVFVRFIYHNDREIKDIHRLGLNSITRTVKYFNENNQLTEVKEFEKSRQSNGDFELIFRQLLNYDELDRLFAEKHYYYLLIRSGNPSNSYKIVHEYGGPENKRSQSTEYDFEGQISELVSYEYDDKGRAIKIEWSYPGKDLKPVQSYKYQNGEIWQDIYFDGFRKTVKVYKDGRYIRKKLYSPTGELSHFIDFQYEYY